MTSKTAAIVGCPGGRIALGEPADIALYDPSLAWTVNAGSLRSQCYVTPWSEMEIIGRGRIAVIDGRLVNAPATPETSAVSDPSKL